jgi:hypothetical protein
MNKSNEYAIEYIMVKWVLDSPDCNQVVAQVVAHDIYTAWRMLDSSVQGWDLSKLLLVVLKANVKGPNHFIRINPDFAPKAPASLPYGNVDYDPDKQRLRESSRLPATSITEK